MTAAAAHRSTDWSLVSQRLGAHLSLIFFGIIFMLPFLWMVSSSLKPSAEIFEIPVRLIPKTFAFTNYPDAIESIRFLRYLANTFIYAVGLMTGAVLSNVFIGYGFARIDWPGRDIVFIIVIATMMLPAQVRFIPLFITYSKWGWLETFAPLIVPAFFGNAFFVFLVRQFMLTFPRDLDDAARVDGANELMIFWRIVAPLSKPAIITIAIFDFMWGWHDYINPLVFLRDPDKFTLSVGLRLFFSQYGAEWALLMAAATMFTLPMIVVFFFAQRTFIEGISFTGVKG
ncbi:MAG: carbohydrate ABC transporter permease [Caldilineaceae bacterium SB0666_bin_21]|nr:carbohydrate ABC transporter permease [Caldilineaceae bacterium SB0666_bin_21]